MKSNLRQLFTALTFCLCLCGTMANAQTASFTYQGKLTDNTLAANGTYQIQFGLFDAQSGGSQIGATQTNAAVIVTDGIFTVNLGFGAAAFDGADRFLQISVFSTATNSFVALNPRQQITSAPYAVRSLNAGVADTATNAANLGNVPSGNFVQTNDSRLSDNRNPTAGSNSYIQNTAAQQPTSSFNISSNGTVGGTLSANLVNTQTEYRIGNGRVLSVAGSGNTFVGGNAGSIGAAAINNSIFGRFAGQSNSGNSNSFFGYAAGLGNTTGKDNSFFGFEAGRQNLTGEENAFFGLFAGVNNTTGDKNTFFGRNSGISNTIGNSNTVIGAFANVGSNNFSHATAIGADAVVHASNTIALGRENGNDKVVIYGLGAAGVTQLCRNNFNQISTCSSSLRYKTNIAPFSSGLNIVNRLKPITFNWKDGGIADLGLGAEDVAEVEELLVIRNEKGEVEGVKYDRIGVVLLNAVKEQQTQIEQQQKQIQNQQEQIEMLKKLVCQTNGQAEICQAKKFEEK